MNNVMGREYDVGDVYMHVYVVQCQAVSSCGETPEPRISFRNSTNLITSASLLPHSITTVMPPTTPSPCFTCRLAASLRQASSNSSTARRQFHASAPRPSRRKPAYPNVTQKRLEAMQAREADISARAAQLRPYTEREKELLRTRYTDEQMKVLELGEAAVDPRHMAEQGRLRGDAFRPTYIDDFATLRPLIDQPARLAVDDAEAKAAAKKLPIPSFTASGSSTAPEDSEDPHLLRLRQQTGLSAQEIRNLRIKNLVAHRVVNQTRMGKIQSLYFLTIAGNQNGMVGVGEGKAAEDEDGRRQAMMNAIRNMRVVPRYEERTIFGEVEAKVGATVVQLGARPPGKMHRFQQLGHVSLMVWQVSVTDVNTSSSSSRERLVSRTLQPGRRGAGTR